MGNLNELTVDELRAMLRAKEKEENENKQRQRDAYEGIRAKTVADIKEGLMSLVEVVKSFSDFVQTEAEGFKSVMAEYGQLRKGDQLGFTIQHNGFKVEVKSCKIKKFDERADMAATRLINFLNAWMMKSAKGVDDAMYQLGMTLLERNKAGELDYKSISKLYDLESKFNDPEYSSIMQLFKESNVVNGTATNYYFYQRSERGVWVKIEPSFNRI